MRRPLVAAAALAAMALSCGAVLLLRADRPEEPSPPSVALAPPPAAGSVPSSSSGAAASPAPARPDPRPSLRELAEAAEAGEEAVRQSLLGLGDAGEATLELKLDVFLQGLREHLEGEAREILRHRGALTEVFLRIDAVQRDLAALDPGSRQSALDRIRREMGFSEDEVARMQEVDARREARWEKGLAYMEERARITRTFEGEALEEELQALREHIFGFEAETLAREERQGFFRYERPRIYGRN